MLATVAAVFAPLSLEELKNALDACTKSSPVGNCEKMARNREICEEGYEWNEQRQVSIMYGTSLKLMKDVCEFVNESDEFHRIDPSKDWDEWKSRRPEFSLYYIALHDYSQDQSLVAAARLVLDGLPKPSAPHISRIIVDYSLTRDDQRNKGWASLLLDFIRRMSNDMNANLYALATEDSCPYWMDKEFTLVHNTYLIARLNIFDDTHLLQDKSNIHDAGSSSDLALLEDSDSDSSEDSDSDSDSSEDSDSDSSEDSDSDSSD